MIYCACFIAYICFILTLTMLWTCLQYRTLPPHRLRQQRVRTTTLYALQCLGQGTAVLNYTHSIDLIKTSFHGSCYDLHLKLHKLNNPPSPQVTDRRSDLDKLCTAHLLSHSSPASCFENPSLLWSQSLLDHPLSSALHGYAMTYSHG